MIIRAVSSQPLHVCMADTGKKRLSFGPSCARVLFLRKSGKIFTDIETAMLVITDDILLVGFLDDGSDHDHTLETILKQAQNVNLKVNPDKYILGVPSFHSLKK